MDMPVTTSVTARLTFLLTTFCCLFAMTLSAQRITIEDAATVVEGDNETVDMIFNVRLDQASDQTVTVDYQSFDIEAQAGLDYVAKSGTLTFNPGVTFTSVVIVILPDVISEGFERLGVRLSNPVGATIFIGEAIGIIADTDEVKLSVADARTLRSNGQITTTISINLQTQFQIWADWETFTNENTTATPNVDFVPANGRVTFSPGQTSKVISITIPVSTVERGDRFFGVRLTAKSHTGVKVAKLTGRMTVGDNLLPLFSIDDIQVSESDNGSNSTAVLTVTLDPAMNVLARVQYATRNGTAIAGSDYVATNGILDFNPGVTSRQITVIILDDDIPQTNEFYVDLTQATNNASILKATGVVTITDNDSGTLVLTLQSTTVAEGSTTIGRVARNSTTNELQVTLTSSDPAVASVPAGIRIRNGSLNETFLITGVQDGERAGDRVATITASAAGLGDSNTVQITVLDRTNTETVIYAYEERGTRFTSSGATVTGNGYLVIDLETGEVNSLVSYSNGSKEHINWAQNGAFYTSSVGASDFWFMSCSSSQQLQPVEAVESFKYAHLYGQLQRNTALGGVAIGDVASAMTGMARTGHATQGSLGILTTSARINLPRTRGYNTSNTLYSEVLSDLATELGVTLNSTSTPAAAEDDGVQVSEHGPLVVYLMSLAGIEAGSGQVRRYTYPGLLVIDYSTHQVRAIPVWRAGNNNRYAVEDWFAGNHAMYPIAAGGGYQVISAMLDRSTDQPFFWIAYGQQKSHELGTGSMQTVPFALVGNIWQHTLAPNGRGAFVQSSFSASIRAETLHVNAEGMDIDEAAAWLISNLLSNRTEGAFKF